MDQKTVRNAEDARALKENRSLTVEQILDEITYRASHGYICYRRHVNIEVIAEIMKLGFKVSYVSGPVGRNVVKIEW